MPKDGLSGPTHAPGAHDMTFDTRSGPFADLDPGSYTLVIESVREVGGREMVNVPFKWPLQAGQTLMAEGETELGAVQLALISSID